MTRTDTDSWDPASSVGATATGVAAARALASKGPSPLIDDPFAEPLVRAVGVDVFVKLANGEIDLRDDGVFSQTMMAEGMAVRTRYFDDFFTSATRRRPAPGGDPGLRVGRARLPAAVARGHRGL